MVVSILVHLFQFTFYFCIGIYLQDKISKGLLSSNIKNITERLSFFQLFIIIFITYSIVVVLIKLVLLTIFLDSHNIVLNLDSISNYTTNPGQAPNPLPNRAPSNSGQSQRYLGQGADSIIMATSLAAGAKLASGLSPAGKAAALAGSVVLGAAALGAKNIAGNMSVNVGNKGGNNGLVSSGFDISTLFNLTGKDTIDLLYFIHYFQFFALISLLLALYYLVFFIVSESTIEYYISKI
jgi:hypothetical protein